MACDSTPDPLDPIPGSSSRTDSEMFGWESDIWALGATLLALRTGDYPFATGVEAKERAELSRQMAEDEIDARTYRKRKKEFDGEVVLRGIGQEAETDLFDEVSKAFDDEPRAIMNEMLAWDLARRPSAADTQRR